MFFSTSRACEPESVLLLACAAQFNLQSSPAYNPLPATHARIAARTAGVNGDMIQRCGVAAFLSRTLSLEVVRHFSRSALYRSAV